jgi:hypothetical protein
MVPLCVIPEGVGTVNPYAETRLGVVGCAPGEAAAVSPPPGSGGAPAAQRDEQPWAVKG